jgi:hypothetical protein
MIELWKMPLSSPLTFRMPDKARDFLDGVTYRSAWFIAHRIRFSPSLFDEAVTDILKAPKTKPKGDKQANHVSLP